jgi:hypothetical protein
MMKFKNLLAVLFAAMLGIPGILADTRQVGDISVSINPGFSGSSGHGSRQVDFVITNRSGQPQNVKLVNEATRGRGYMASLRRISAEVRVPANSSIKIPVFTPCVNIPESRLLLYVNGSAKRIDPPLLEKLNYYSTYNNGISVLAVRGAILAKASKKGSYGRDQLIFNTSGIPESEWSESPQAYSRFDLVTITDESLNEMSPAIKKALLRYAELGGVLFIQGSANSFNIPAPWHQTVKKNGFMNVWSVGFGRVAVCKRDKKQVEPSWNKLKSICDPMRQRLCEEAKRRAGDANNKFPIIDEMQISPIVLLGILVVFSIIIGPVNILYLTKKKKKLLLLVTVPVISIIFTIAVFAYSFLAEGWHARSRYDTFTMLDQQNGRATSYGFLGFYCPIPPYKGLVFSKDIILNFQAPSRDDSELKIDWTREQRLADGFVKPKVPARFFFRKNEPRRERIQIKRIAKGRILVTNGIGTELTDFNLVLNDDSLFQIKKLEAGAAIEVVAVTGGKFDRPIHDLRRRLAGADVSQPGSMRGMYTAIMARSPFVKPGIEDTEHRENSRILGILSEKEAVE